MIFVYISEIEGLCSDDPGGRDNDCTTPAIKNLDIKTHLENNINFDIITIKTMSETTTAIAVEVKEVASAQGAADTKVQLVINNIAIAKNSDGNMLYYINFDKAVPTADGTNRAYIWFTPARLRHNLIDTEPDFDIIIAANREAAIKNDVVDWLPLSLAQAKAYLIGSTIELECKFIAAGEIVEYSDASYTYEHDAMLYTIVSIELTAKARSRLDRKIDSLL